MFLPADDERLPGRTVKCDGGGGWKVIDGRFVGVFSRHKTIVV